MDTKVRKSTTRAKFYDERQNGPRPTPALPENLAMPVPVAIDALDDLTEGAGYFLVPKAIVDNDLNVQVNWWPAISTGLTLQAVWNGTPVGAPYTILQTDKDDPTRVFNFIVPAAVMSASPHGWYALQYRTAVPPNPPGLNPVFSRSTTIIVDRVAPGGEQLPPLLFVSDVSDGVTEDDLDNNGNLEAIVADYYDMKEGDVVTPWIGSADGLTGEFVDANAETVDQDEVGTQRVHILFPRALLEKYGDGPVGFGYKLRDRAGNESLQLDPVTVVELLLKDAPSGFLAPLVPLAEDDGIITDSDARVPVTVSIPQYTNAKPGDLITVHWGGVDLPTRPLAAGEELLDPMVTDIVVKYAQLLPAGTETGSAVVTYSVRRGVNTFPLSAATTVEIDLRIPGGPDPDPETPINENLKPLIVTSASGQTDHIPEPDFTQNATVTIPWQTVDNRQAMFPNDTVAIRWGTQPAVSVTLGTGQGTVDLVQTIQTGFIQTEGPGLKNVDYTITRAYATPPPPHTGTALSPPKEVLVESHIGFPGDGQPLVKPGLPEAVDYGGGVLVIDRAAGYDGTPVRCPLTDTNIAAGDRIQLLFIGRAGFDGLGPEIEASRYEPSRYITPQEAAVGTKAAIFDVPANIMRALCAGTVAPTYKVTNSVGTTESRPADVVIVQLSNGGDATCSLPNP